MTMIHSESPCIEFSIESRCDRCGSQAYMCAERDGMLLLFCGHHSRNHRDTLKDEGWKLTWDSEGYIDLAPQHAPLLLV